MSSCMHEGTRHDRLRVFTNERIVHTDKNHDLGLRLVSFT